MYNTRSRARRAQQPFPPFGRQPPPGARGRRGAQDTSSYLLYSLLSAIYQRCVRLM